MVTKKQSKQKKPSSDSRVNMAVNRLYTKSAPLLVFEAILFGFAAILIFVKPIAIMATLTMLLGIGVGLFGIYQLFVGLFGGERDMAGKTMNIVLGIVGIIVGIVFLAQPQGSMIAVVYIFAIMFMVRAISSLILSIRLWRAKFGNYMLDIVMSLLMIALAILVMFFPGFGMVTAMYFLAATLLLYAIADISMYSKLLKLKRAVNED